MGTNLSENTQGALTCVHIVEGVCYPVQSLKKVVIINAFTLWPDAVLVRNGIERRVHSLSSLYGRCALRFLKKRAMEKGGKMESGESKRGVSRRGRSGKEGGIIERGKGEKLVVLEVGRWERSASKRGGG